jgi:hypothetical protein
MMIIKLGSKISAKAGCPITGFPSLDGRGSRGGWSPPPMPLVAFCEFSEVI